MDEARVETSSFIWYVLGDIDGSAAVLAAERESLKHTNHEKNYRSCYTDRGVGWKKADQCSSATHDQQRDEERILASHQIADASEEECSEGANHKSDGEGREVSDQRQRVVTFGIKERSDGYGEAAKDVEVVPLDHGADC